MSMSKWDLQETPSSPHSNIQSFLDSVTPTVPTTQVYELAKSYPALLTLNSTDVSAYSWMSVAWYPIYQIPEVRNVKELSASFLTYHQLSTSSIKAKGYLPNSTVEEDNMSGGSKGNNLGSEIKIHPFAMASYKMFGTLWTNPGSSDQNIILSHLNDAASWLNQQNFWHPDFNFFVSRRHRRY
ncbi:hypothetical protein Ddye_029926 [Dipteronia dyeriana]|uniref:Uncharacterized protein n=1 Tax=Dipteronia dyeriana TaxID=168575 RepID=A0AAD9TGG0_9ROSI|nr:hypothetical protein Ddye_029926 [Dipteronia dyeriana]